MIETIVAACIVVPCGAFLWWMTSSHGAARLRAEDVYVSWLVAEHGHRSRTTEASTKDGAGHA